MDNKLSYAIKKSEVDMIKHILHADNSDDGVKRLYTIMCNSFGSERAFIKADLNGKYMVDFHDTAKIINDWLKKPNDNDLENVLNVIYVYMYKVHTLK